MADTVRSYARRNQSRGQIAVFLLLVMAVLFLFTVITYNIGEVSKFRTIVSNATDASALRYASKVSSLGWAMWKKTLRMMDTTDNGNTFRVCKWSWVTFFTVMGLIAIIALSIIFPGFAVMAGMMLGQALGLGATAIVTMGVIGAWAQIAASATSVLISSGHDAAVLSTLQSSINQLPAKSGIVEDVALFGLSQVVDDPKTVLDAHDLNKNNSTTDYISRFSLLYAMRLKGIRGQYDILRQLAEAIKGFYFAADPFRQDWGGIQEFPELQVYPQSVIDDLRNRLGYNVADNNLFYPQDGEAMRLLADFMGYRMPRTGCGRKPFLQITNVNISQLNADPPVLPRYPEEIKFYFPFLNPPGRFGCCNPDGPQFSCWPMDLPPPVEPQYQGPCDLGGLGENDTMTTPVDEVDYTVWELATYKPWAWGLFDVDYDLPEYDPNAMKFNTSFTQRSVTEMARGFNVWYRQLYDVDGVGGDQAKSTWYVRIKDFVKKVISDPEGALNKCGWFKEIDKVLRDKQFFGPGSDVAGQYSGLGKITRTMANDTPWPYPGGKRKEFMDKIDRICDRLTPLIPQFNGRLCPFFAWGPLCGGDVPGGSVPATTRLALETGLGQGQACKGNSCPPCFKNTDCVPCYSVARMQAIVNAINLKIAEVNRSLTTLTDTQRACEQCCSAKYQACMALAKDRGDSCRGGCPADDPLTEETDENADCVSGCDSQQAAEEGICGDEYAACSAGCATLQPAIDCRDREIRELNVMLTLAEAMLQLAETLQTVEQWITDFETRELGMVTLWTGANSLIGTMRSLEAQLRALDRALMYGDNDEYPAQSFEGATLVSRKVGNGVEIEYVWPTQTNGVQTDHSAKIWMSTDFKMPSVKTYKCKLIFGKGAELVDYTGNMAVEMTRWDGERNLIMSFFRWLFKVNTTTSRTSAVFHADASRIRVTPER